MKGGDVYACINIKSGMRLGRTPDAGKAAPKGQALRSAALR